jgi:uncharacterized protein with ATP-grasp and redox domains
MTKKEFTPFTYGEDPDLDAWFTVFFLENHIDPFAYPTKVGSVEQIKFMIFTEGHERYYPCSDETFAAIMNRNNAKYLNQSYKLVLERIMGMVDEFIDLEYENQFLKSLIKIKYEHEISKGIIIPSRLEKRLYKIFLSRTHIENPYSGIKKAYNKNAKKFLSSETFKKALNNIEDVFESIHESSLHELQGKIREIEFLRLLSLIHAQYLWKDEKTKIPRLAEIKDIFHTRISGNGLAPLIEVVKSDRNRILWLLDEPGELMIDIALAKFMASLGHTIIFAVKEAPFFKKISLIDTREDPTLIRELEDVESIHGKTTSKNELVKLLKQDKKIFIVSDGTKENLNLLLTSTTFSRIFKEVDLVISRGHDQKIRLIDPHFEFTQNIINISREKTHLSLSFKPRHSETIKFSHEDLEAKADTIIEQMIAARNKDMTVMFYSGVIGSIPGKIDVAKKIMTVYIDFLHQRNANLFIINPSKYYETGMDADDLMYMWEIVQRSGVIDIWRFQTFEDIAKAFSIMNKKIPPEWVGKDSTYSTGCTKEMRIAQDVQKQNTEMQLIGPALDKFMRRDDYGVGSMYDQRLAAS